MAVEIEARYRVVTPLFGGGADPAVRAELRLTAFKGALRYWWRALAWSRLDGNLVAIRDRENDLFGSAGGGASRLSMRLSPCPEAREIRVGQVSLGSGRNREAVGHGARYLGYGVMEAFASRQKGTEAGQLTRPCLAAPFDFTVRIRARGLDAARLESVENALVALGLFGGMGSKSRKGYGSLAIRSLAVDGAARWTPPRSIEELRDALIALRKNHRRRGLPEFTAFSAKTRQLLVACDSPEPMALLDRVGREIVRYRSFGRDGRIPGNELSERNFRDDHDLMKRPPNRPTRHPRRIAFGLPHNYGKRKNDQVVPGDPGLDRRASPLFIHIHECAAGPVAVLSFLPARFLPGDAPKISVGGKSVRQAPEEELYRPVHEFLDRLLDPARRKESFAAVMEAAP